MTRAGCFTIDSAHIALHFVRKARAVKRRTFDAAQLLEQLERAAVEELEVLEREVR